MKDLRIKTTEYRGGLTLLELMFSVSILLIVGIVVARFQADIFSLNANLQNSFSEDDQARNIILPMTNEIRSASPSSLGAYPIATAASDTLTFYTDLNNNGLEEQVSYFVSGNSLEKSVIVPTGNPYVYDSSSEVVTTVLSDLTNGSSTTLPVFQYYDDSYTGTSSPLGEPVSPLSVRLIKINFAIDADPNRSPVRIITTQVEIRSLKDNL